MKLGHFFSFGSRVYVGKYGLRLQSSSVIWLNAFIPILHYKTCSSQNTCSGAVGYPSRFSSESPAVSNAIQTHLTRTDVGEKYNSANRIPWICAKDNCTTLSRADALLPSSHASCFPNLSYDLRFVICKASSVYFPLFKEHIGRHSLRPFLIWPSVHGDLPPRRAGLSRDRCTLPLGALDPNLPLYPSTPQRQFVRKLGIYSNYCERSTDSFRCSVV